MNKNKAFREGISEFVPANALDEVCRLAASHPFHLTITRSRKTKKGDFRPGFRGKSHRISINVDLNPFDFLLTYVHEYAHLLVWINYGRNNKPHGIEWKQEFQKHLIPFFELEVFPDDVARAIANYIRNPKASSCSDVELQKTLNSYNINGNELTIEDIDEGTLFLFNDTRLFKKGKRLRKRYACIEVTTNRHFRFSPLAPIKLYKTESEPVA